MNETTHFGYQTIDYDEKNARVGAVFDSVASRYDIMNDVMSFGVHRLWKDWYVWQTDVKPGETVLDLAAGTGDISARLGKKMRAPGHGGDVSGQLIVSDINAEMLARGRERLLNEGFLANVDFVLANAEALPFADNSIDLITMAFGLRNVTDQAQAIKEMHRVLKPGGRVLVLEFSKPTSSLLSKAYDWYSFNFLPQMGQWIAGDRESYQYLAESIRMHPDQDTLQTMFSEAGFAKVAYQNINKGIVAIHKGVKA
ncbi:bifunctional demethylmenaquinone methyltransferase/2-methoxy-6-polyprenyl-1,4-benzoquinol methylase UbiE [Suttonella sp. R2A3]|uniref:bifunctional demethylmenaquinone methyltransferase/2-methoxy-6-polyprenyl-1,4-benzoquinol methylase UbiE n=1 Tax=Suttonella sp. R2A3 TaxID=2908648 RepID=UPI001F2902C5|nr:bifunctional demethylmenaquinone methyltransferase/2-methoxy-6-polyprenyl-1,4-benzoquinol methylase UbiE [Suttonella sp. R2A3]UJF24854.1 bifunctional demethylmenaquinone methyltransferase/2-methoxy-6-polyprenyl-1,4-benzoquinol methylase UbiE [Suttonella sp. R2A3]